MMLLTFWVFVHTDAIASMAADLLKGLQPDAGNCGINLHW